MANDTFINPSIGRARSAALARLKPTEAELRRGIELHRDALVIDAYGFSGHAAVDAQRLEEMSSRNDDIDVIRRRYTDMMMTRMADDTDEAADFAEAWRASGVTCVFRNSGEEGNAIPQLIERLAHNTHVTDRLPHLMMRATEPEHIEQAKREGRHCFYFSTNGVPLALQFRSVIHEISWIRVFAQLGVRMMHLTYNRRNPIGDGCAENSGGGLSDLGVEVVREMNRVGVIVDGAHSNDQTCVDAARTSDAPVVISHAMCASLRPHCRAKRDDTIRAVAESGGYIGIVCVPAFLGGTGDINALLDHIDHVVRLVGHEHVAIGTDRATYSRAAEMQEVDLPRRPLRPFESFWPEGMADDGDGPWREPEAVESLAWTNFPLFTVGLVRRGYTDDAIRAILGGNAMRVAKAVWARRETGTPGSKPQDQG